METSGYLYLELAQRIEQGITSGDFQAGEKLPSLRKLHQRTGRSLTTVYQAYMELERRGLVTSHPRSGFIVNPDTTLFNLPEARVKETYPALVSQTTLLSSIVSSLSDPSILPLGCAYTSMDMMPQKHLARILRKVLSRDPGGLVSYENTMGNTELRKHLALWLSERVGRISSEDILMTSGGTEAISICLRAIAEKGDTILIESPAYPGVLQIMEDMGLFALEIPTDPVYGIDLSMVKKIVKKERIKGCFLTPTVHNPMGFVMPERNMEELVSLFSSIDIPVIEDDTYGELTFGGKRPGTLKYYDKKGLVIYISSFSKIVGGGLRTGYVVPGRYMEQVKKIKLGSSLTSTTITQKILAEFIMQGGLDRHLCKLTNFCRRNLDLSMKAVRRYFPEEVRVSSPAGGFLLWLEMPGHVDSMDVFQTAWKEGISIFPGRAFSVTGLYDNCFRLNCGNSWNERIEKGFMILGEIVRRSC